MFLWRKKKYSNTFGLKKKKAPNQELWYFLPLIRVYFICPKQPKKWLPSPGYYNFSRRGWIVFDWKKHIIYSCVRNHKRKYGITLNICTFIATDKSGYPYDTFLISPQKYMLWGFIRNAEAFLMNPHNICFCWEIRKISILFGWKKCLIRSFMFQTVRKFSFYGNDTVDLQWLKRLWDPGKW